MKKYLKIIIMFLIFISSIIFVNHNEEMYDYPILRVSNIKIDKIKDEYNNNLKEEYYYETITGTIINSDYKGCVTSFQNVRSFSGVYDEKYDINDEVFVSLNDDGTVNEVINLRRDKYLIPLMLLMLCLLFIVGEKKGIYTFISLLINLGIIFSITYFRDLGANIFYLFLIGSVLMCTISLILTSGLNKKTLVAVLSSIISLIITFGLSYLIIIIFNSDIPYWYMDYVDILYDYKEVFLTSVLISGLGAIMDISISIVSTLNELIVNSPKISINSLKKAGFHLSDDILGTMVNVLLFTSITSSIPMLIFVMRNNIKVLSAFNMYAKIEMIRFMTGCIGILVTIPIALYLSIYFYKGRIK